MDPQFSGKTADAHRCQHHLLREQGLPQALRTDNDPLRIAACAWLRLPGYAGIPFPLISQNNFGAHDPLTERDHRSQRAKTPIDPLSYAVGAALSLQKTFPFSRRMRMSALWPLSF